MCRDKTTLVRLTKHNESGRNIVPVDSCIASEIQQLNDSGVVTVGCCCGHGSSGRIIEWDNAFGHWKGYIDPPHVLIEKGSKELVEELGYRPFPYYYADGQKHEVLKAYLKTGCLTEEDCFNWNSSEEQETPH